LYDLNLIINFQFYNFPSNLLINIIVPNRAQLFHQNTKHSTFKSGLLKL